MTKKEQDLFDRLRDVGLRKQVAKALCEIDHGAGKKAVRLGRSAVDEFRALADQIERRLPSVATGRSATVEVTESASAPARASRPRAARARAASTTANRARRPAVARKPAVASSSPARRPAAARKSATVPAQAGAASGTSAARAPRGENKAKILKSLQAGPKTASEVAGQTGIGTATVSSTLTKLAKTGEVVKADRGYALPK